MDVPPPQPALYYHVEQTEEANPLLTEEGLIPFDLIKPQHFVPAIKMLIQELEPEVVELESTRTPTWETIIIPLEQIEEKLHRVVGPMEHLTLVMDSVEIRRAWKEVEPLVTAFELRIKQSHPLYVALEAICSGVEWKTLSEVQKRIVNQRLQQAQLKGVHLVGEKRTQFNTYVHELNELQTLYIANKLDAAKNYSLFIDDKRLVEGIPFPILKLASQSYNYTKDKESPTSSPQEGPWKFSLNPPYYLGIMRHCKNRALREQIYRAQIQKASVGSHNNSENILRQLKIRKELSRLLGFDSYADLSLITKMAPNVMTVKSFLEDLRSASWDAGKEDYDDVQVFANEQGFEGKLMPWDFAYYSERLREKRFHISEEDLKPFFSFSTVLSGLFELCEELFGVIISPADFKAPVWHLDVTYYIIRDEQGEQVASFYLDPYARPQTKRSGAWTETCLNRIWMDEKLQKPIAYIVCNSTPPVGESPALLTLREMETLFHEFGHALQHVLTDVDYASVSGVNGMEWDAIETVSKFMENWCYHKPTLRRLAKHHQTGEALPEEVMDKIIAARSYHAGSHMLAQLKYSMADLALHHEFDPQGEVSPFEIWYDICEYTSHVPCLEEDRFLCSFHHIFGNDAYAAGYYSYKWAEVLSADAFSAFEEVDMNDKPALRSIGERFRQTFLALGGSLHPTKVFELFRGRKPKIDALLEQKGFTKKRVCVSKK